MVYDSLDNFIEKLPRYMPRCAELAEFLRAAREKSFDELKDMDFPQLDLRFNEYETKPETEIPFEAHRKLWDLQLVLEGEEMIGVAPLASLTETVSYDEAEDIAFYKGSGSAVKLARGVAALLAPWDGHRPGASCGEIQLFKETAVNRHSALDAESSGFKFRCVTVFNAAGCRVGARHDVRAMFLKKV